MNVKMKKVELLSPAKDLAIGMAAIQNGADAVYIGAPAFGARKAAANSLEDIACLTAYAHRFYCRVFVTLNTILYDHELAEAEKMIWKLYEIGVDALIVQDLGVLRLNLPPICLHASTQMHNFDLDRIRFIEQMGFQRIVLARELSLEEIRKVREAVKTELEVFVHGALCVSMSGQCYLSHYMFGRSANRGECAQPCRMRWTVEDAVGKELIKDRYILSLKDLNLSSYLKDLVDIGVESFKIEGRLKDENYVANVSNYYSSLLNSFPNVKRSGSGKVFSSFVPSPERSFNRGYSTYFMGGRKQGLVNSNTPKSMGKQIGILKQIKGQRLLLEMEDPVHNGDGLCYMENNELRGIRVNRVEGNWVECNEVVKIKVGTALFRNYDHQFVSQLEKSKSSRKIEISMHVTVLDQRLKIEAIDEDGNRVAIVSDTCFEEANNPQQRERLLQQLSKCGDSDYVCQEITYTDKKVLFIPTAIANAFRRQVLELLDQKREENRVKMEKGEENKQCLYTGKNDWHLNIVNRNAALFYQEHGLAQIEHGFEKNHNARGCDLMHTRYCILYELGRCRKKNGNTDLQFPLFLHNDKQRFQLEFDCQVCEMRIKAL